MPTNGDEHKHEHETGLPEAEPPIVFRVGPKSPKASGSGEIVAEGQLVAVGSAREFEDVPEISGTLAVTVKLSGNLEEVVVRRPPVISSYHDLKRTTFLIDFYHSGDPDEQYQVRYLESDRRSQHEEWEELDHDLEALLLEVLRRMNDRMTRGPGS